jgi:hypothetical protein
MILEECGMKRQFQDVGDRQERKSALNRSSEERKAHEKTLAEMESTESSQGTPGTLGRSSERVERLKMWLTVLRSP